jgi:hypothetical protein
MTLVSVAHGFLTAERPRLEAAAREDDPSEARNDDADREAARPFAPAA